MSLVKNLIKSNYCGLFALSLLLSACEPAEGDFGTDPSALLDQNPVRAEGWTLDGSNSEDIEGLMLAAQPAPRGENFIAESFTLQNSGLYQRFPELQGLQTGTARIKFRIARRSPTGIRFLVSFATGVGLPIEVKVSGNGFVAKCGSFELDDGIESETVSKTLEDRRDYELYLVRNETNYHLILDSAMLIQSKECLAAQQVTDEGRPSGWLRIRLHSEKPTVNKVLSTSDFSRWENQLLLRRISIYSEAKLP